MNCSSVIQRTLGSLALALAVLMLPSVASAQVTCCNTTTLACSITTTQAACVISGGVFYSNATSCPATNPCQIRCCLANGSCALLIFNTTAACPGGNFGSGAGGCTPQPGPCPGACCNRWTGSCVVESTATCQAHGLRFDGVGSACSPVTCKACPADFDGNSAVSVADIFAFLSSWFAGCP